jgi:hypothetical protein
METNKTDRSRSRVRIKKNRNGETGNRRDGDAGTQRRSEAAIMIRKGKGRPGRERYLLSIGV